MELQELQKIFTKGDLSPSIIGQDFAKKQIKSALISGRNIILVGPPGVGKTTLAHDIAKHLPEVEMSEDEVYSLYGTAKQSGSKKKVKVPGEKRFIRVQGSPDLTAEDLIGDIDPMKAMKYGPLSIEAFTPGKIFKAHNGILFFDEVNRCSEKLQNALLQVLAEKKATVGSYEIDFKADVLFIATMNPKDFSTENLSDVFLDRFDMVHIGYPESLQIEFDIALEKSKHLIDLTTKKNKQLTHMIVAFCRSLRNSKKLEKFPSVRATLGLLERTQANAILAGRKDIMIDDFYEARDSVLAHRIKLKPSVRYVQSPKEVLDEEFKSFTKANNFDLDEFSAPQKEMENEPSEDG